MVGAVDHDLGDLRVGEEGVDRSVAEDVVGDLLEELETVGTRQRDRLLLVERPLEHLHDAELELGIAHLAVVQGGTETLDDLVVELAPEVLTHLLSVALEGDLSRLRRFHAVGKAHLAPPISLAS